MNQDRAGGPPLNFSQNLLLYLICVIIAAVIGLTNDAPANYYYFLLTLSGYVLGRVLLGK
jgi:hypothetical protein